MVAATSYALLAASPSMLGTVGQRRVECVSPDDRPECLRALGIHYVVINGAAVHKTHGTIQNWMQKYDATLVDNFTFPRPEMKTVIPPELYLVRLN